MNHSRKIHQKTNKINYKYDIVIKNGKKYRIRYKPKQIVKKNRTIKKRVVGNKHNLDFMLDPRNMPEKETTYAIRFYDNQPYILDQFKRSKKYIESIPVSTERNKDVLLGTKEAKNYTREFLKLHPDNTYARYLNNMNNTEIDSCVGFSLEDAKCLSQWADRPEIHKKVAIFDWDGTLSVVEGLIVPTVKEYADFTSGKISYEDAGVYYCGSKQRLDVLKKLFHKLRKDGVEIYILTNNPIALKTKNSMGLSMEPHSRKHFHQILKRIIPGIRDEHIMCGYETNGFKPSTFSNNKHLREIYNKMHSWNMRCMN